MVILLLFPDFECQQTNAGTLERAGARIIGIAAFAGILGHETDRAASPLERFAGKDVVIETIVSGLVFLFMIGRSV
jgi:hypothetical protein